MRDALSMLDQVVSFSGDKMTIEDALLVTGSIGQDVFFQLADALIDKDIAKALSLHRKVNRRWQRSSSINRGFYNLL